VRAVGRWHAEACVQREVGFEKERKRETRVLHVANVGFWRILSRTLLLGPSWAESFLSM
jgi:hypothetical protein